ncbi:MAG TPA: SPW repeat protein [Nitrolancea sp.]|nr:SPW repeat protein [Nitrolancea sp.]
MSPAVRMRLPGIISLILGLWLILGSFIGGFGSIASKTSDVILGFFLAFLSIQVSIPTEDTRWMFLMNGLIGITAIAAPWIFDYSDIGTATTNNIIVGILIVLVSAWGYLTAQLNSNATA